MLYIRYDIYQKRPLFSRLHGPQSPALSTVTKSENADIDLN